MHAPENTSIVSFYQPNEADDMVGRFWHASSIYNLNSK